MKLQADGDSFKRNAGVQVPRTNPEAMECARMQIIPKVH